MKIAVAGLRYAGLLMVVLLAQHNIITSVDIISEKTRRINGKNII